MHVMYVHLRNWMEMFGRCCRKKKHLFISSPWISVWRNKIWTICILRLLSYINTHWVLFFIFLFYGLRDRSCGAIGEVRCWRHDVRAAACGTLQPPRPPPSSPERHTLSGRQPRGPVISSHLFCIYHNPLHPSCMVDIIFSSSFLGDMGDHSKSK